MKNIVQLFFVVFSFFCFGQEKNLWYPFFLENSNTMGFKDKEGKVMIEPKFFAPLSTGNFNNIYAVNEIDGDEYYLLKNGKKIGIDSVYYFDTEAAYEREEKIRFRDKKTDRVGFFDKNGIVIIPAIYNEAENFYNDLAIVYKDGKRWCYDNNSEERKNCEHYGWINTKAIVINPKNQQLFEINDDDYNLYDFRNIYKNFKLNENVDSDIYTSYKGNDGNIYSFYSPEKDFKKWFETKFLPDFKTNGRIIGKYFTNSIELQIEESSVIIDKKDFITKGFNKNINKLFDDYIKNKYSVDYFNENIFNEDSRDISIDLRFTSKIENKDDKSVRKFSQKSIIFKKIGDSFYITTTY